MRRLIVPLAIILALLAPTPALAGDPPVEITGRLLVAGWGLSGDIAYFLEGTSNNVTPAAETFVLGDIAPHADEVTYSVVWGDGFVATGGDVWKAGVDGSGAVNLTGPAGVGGVNCRSRWSPDGSMIAFHHADPAEGELPCEAGFHVWVMNSDGTSRYRVTAEANAPTWFPRWSPNGYRLLCEEYGLGAITIDLDGTDKTFVPGVIGEDGEWSDDGRMLVSSWIQDDVVDGEPGIWRQLRLANRDGSDPRVLVEQFIKDSDVQAHIELHQFDEEQFDWFTSIRALAGPMNPAWSPAGDKIAFLGALPFGPGGIDYRRQVEVWVYELETADLTRITDNEDAEVSLSWNGDNTYPSHPDVTVDNATVAFDEVLSQGLTTIIRDDDPPELPAGYQFADDFYEFHTTAEISGAITVCFTYNDEDIPSGAEETLAIYHYNEDTAEWEDVTSFRDPENNIVCCVVESLSLFGPSLRIPAGHFPDVPPSGYGPKGLHPYWAFWEIEACVDAGVAAGYTDGTFGPATSVARDQMAVFIARALAGGEASVPAGPPEATFDDVPAGYWAYDHVEYCVAADVVQGYSPDTYGPANLVSRDAMAVFIARAHAGGDASVPDGPAEATFDDVPTEYWSYKYIEYCVANGLVHGYDPVTYGPAGVVTRDQMAVFICRAFDLPL